MYGHDGTASILTVEKSTDQAGSWADVSQTAAADPKFNSACAFFDNKMWIIGGSDDDLLYNSVWSSTDGATWTEESSNPGFSIREGHKAVVFKNELYIVGGSNGTQFLTDVWKSADGITWQYIGDLNIARTKFAITA